MIIRFGLALLLLWSGSVEASVLWFAGGEVGDFSETFNTHLNVTCSQVESGAAPGYSGNYNYRLEGCNGGNYVGSSTGLGGTTLFTRMRFGGDLDGNNPCSANFIIQSAQNAGGTHSLNLVVAKGSPHVLSANFDGGAAIGTGTTDLVLTSTSTTYLIDVKYVVSASVGGVEVRINGVVEFTALATNTSSLGTFDQAFFGVETASNCNGMHFDDLMACSSAYCGSGRTIARQGAAGSPTYTAWTKNSCTGGTIDGCWSNTPFTTGSNATSSTASDAQTMLVHDFGTTQSGHGTETINVHDTINACKTALVAKTASASDISIRRRIASADTDTNKTLTTSDAYYDDGIWTTTTTNLRSSTMEIGAVHGTGVNLDTVEDVWMLCDVLAVPVVRHKVTQ